MNRAKQPTAGPDQPNSHSFGIVKKSVWNKGIQNSFLQFTTTRWMEIICLICDEIDVAAGCVTSLRSLMVMMRMFTKKKTRKIYHPSTFLCLLFYLFICLYVFIYSLLFFHFYWGFRRVNNTHRKIFNAIILNNTVIIMNLSEMKRFRVYWTQICVKYTRSHNNAYEAESVWLSIERQLVIDA